MAHDVFISYSSKDKTVADAVTASLEAKGIRCWIAPRDIPPGTDWSAAIIAAISQCRVMVLIFSAHSNTSEQVKREVERCVAKGKALIPLRINDVPLSPSLEYFISTPHWLDAMTPPLRQHLERLAAAVRPLVTLSDGRPAVQPAVVHARPTAPAPEPQPAPSAVAQPRVPAQVRPPKARSRRRWAGLAACIIVIITTAVWAARRMNRSAAFDQGYAYYLGRGVPHDARQAAYWWQRAAEAGDSRAQAALGLLYATGYGVPEDDSAALLWYRRAAADGEPAALVAMADLYNSGGGGIGPADKAKAAELYRQALATCQRAADAGDPRGMAELGFMYKQGLGGLPQDQARAKELLQKAADAGDPVAMTGLAALYASEVGYRGGNEYGSGATTHPWVVDKDLARAAQWYGKAADAGYQPAMSALAWLYEDGVDARTAATRPTLVLKDLGRAAELYQKAADAGDARAMCRLALLYETGKGVPKDDVRAVAWYRAAANSGSEYAKEALTKKGLAP